MYPGGRERLDVYSSIYSSLLGRELQDKKVSKRSFKKENRVSRHSDETKAIDELIGRNIRELRISLGLSRDQLGKKIGVTHQQLQKYEVSSNRISASRLVIVAKALGKRVSYFSGDSDEEIYDMHSRMTIELQRNFSKLNCNMRMIINNLVKMLAVDK